MPERINCTFFRDSFDRWGRRVSTTWDALAARCCDHRIGDKDGPALSCGLFSGARGNATLTHRTLVALDIETHRVTGEVPLDVIEAVRYLEQRHIRSVVWTTYNHTTDAPRYRVLLPLPAPIEHDPETDPFLSAVVAAELRFSGVADASKFGAASLFFLPRHAADAERWFAVSIDGDLMDIGRLQTAALMAAQGVARDEAEEAARRRANALPPEIVERIAAYNATHSLPERLERYGYRRNGNRWRSRYQHGIASTSILPDGMTWTSFSESDAQAGVGHRPQRASSQCACWGDAFALYVHYEHRNNFRAALAALGA